MHDQARLESVVLPPLPEPSETPVELPGEDRGGDQSPRPGMRGRERERESISNERTDQPTNIYCDQYFLQTSEKFQSTGRMAARFLVLRLCYFSFSFSYR